MDGLPSVSGWSYIVCVSRERLTYLIEALL